MARLRAELKRSFLRSLWREAKAATSSLDQCLADFQSSCFVFLRDGKIVSSTSQGGNSTAFEALSSSLEVTPTEILALSEEFFAVKTDAVSTLTAAGAPTDDDSVFETMLLDDRMVGHRAEQLDSTSLRFSYGLTR